MLKPIQRWTIGVAAVIITIWLAKRVGIILHWPNFIHLVIFVPVLALVNVSLGSILKLIALPITCLTFGMFSFVINAMVFWAAGAITGAQMNFWTALFGSFFVPLISGLLNGLVRENE